MSNNKQGNVIVVGKALGPENIDETLQLSREYDGKDRNDTSDPRIIDITPPRKRVVIDDTSSSSSRSRSRSPTRWGRYEDRERERRHRRSYRSPPYRDFDDSDDSQEAYSFVLSRHRKSLPSRDSTAGSLSDISEKELVPLSHASSKVAQPGKLHVLQSKYTGEGTIGGFQSAALKVFENSSAGNRKIPHSIFRWMYVNFSWHEQMRKLI